MRPEGGQWGATEVTWGDMHDQACHPMPGAAEEEKGKETGQEARNGRASAWQLWGWRRIDGLRGPGGWSLDPGRIQEEDAQFVVAGVGVDTELVWAMKHSKSCGESRGKP